MFSFFKEELFLNIFFKSLSIFGSKEYNTKYFKEVQSLNIKHADISLVIINEDKSIDSNEKQ